MSPMRGQDITDLILLSAIWGSSFLFMRLAVGDLGPFPLMAMRTGLALMVILPLLLWRHGVPSLVKDWKPIFMVGIVNAAIPFSLLAYAAITIPAGVLSILNAATPLWGATIALFWLKDKLPWPRLFGLGVGFSGIILLVWEEFEIDAVLSSGLGLAAGLLAPVFFGFAASYTKRHLMGRDPLAVATGALISATLVLTPLAWLTWPTTEISTQTWGSVLMLSVLCTGMTYIIFYRLLMNVGPAKASTVTLLIPVFGVLWGWLWLNEHVSTLILSGAGVILFGTAFATGILGERRRSASA